MANNNLFEVATKTKMRFPFRGLISVEDLWDLSLQNLDQVFKVLNSELKQVNEESLLNTKTKEDKELDVKIKIVKHIVKVKLEEEESRQQAKVKKEQKQRIMEILSQKQDESLQNKSIEELKALLEEVDN
ncbi:hypothetical protein [Siminovitchia sp. 179-K 8D1 HS]|uniref:hypothetical protein n=1 Tax=Siminovitchia sp. 179-K 8D1 HS TaxID=3142385 RepID=UPI0039A058F7